MSRSRWAAIGAALAVTLGAGGLSVTHAVTTGGERAIYVPISPCRLGDSRPSSATFVGPLSGPLGARRTQTYSGWGNVAGDCNLPSGTSALALNVTAVNATQPTNLRLHPADAATPDTSNLNVRPDSPPVFNAVTVGLDATGKFKLYNASGSVDVILDVVGYYDDHRHDDRYYTRSAVDDKIAAIPAGATGATGARGVSAWDTIPSGVTVKGNFEWDAVVWADVSNDFAFEVNLPAIAPAPLSDATINFAPTVSGNGSSAWLDDADATCTGTTANPTAPPGKVCIYAENLVSVRSLLGFAGYGFTDHLDNRSFTISYLYEAGTATAGDDLYLNGTWAYTAP